MRRHPTPENSRFPWTRRIEYSHGKGHRLTCLTDSARSAAPPGLLKLRPGKGQLFTPTQAVALLTSAITQLRLSSLHLSTCEVTTDVAVPWEEYEAVGRALWLPRARREDQFGEDPTRYLGSPRSARQVRLYWKVEGGHQWARCELILRRKALRGLGVVRPHHLGMIDWASIVACAAQFVMLDITQTRGRDPVLLRDLRTRCQYQGTAATLKSTEPHLRRWLLTRLRPLPVQQQLEAAWAQMISTTTATQ